VKWKVPTTGGPQGLLSTAGGLVFGTDGAGTFIAFDAADGKPLWHAGTGTTTNAPVSYMLDGKQYVVVGAGDTLYAFSLQ
jgi:alcohol dehydrogenase (cytochrome c)